MERQGDQDRSVIERLERLERAQFLALWQLGDHGWAVARPSLRQASYRADWADCECPGDCPRDHANE